MSGGDGPIKRRRFYTVAAGAPIAKCKGPRCGKPIYFITIPGKARPLPVDCDVAGGVIPSENVDETQVGIFDEGPVQDGRGVSHFETCIDAQHFRRGIPD